MKLLSTTPCLTAAAMALLGLFATTTFVRPSEAAPAAASAASPADAAQTTTALANALVAAVASISDATPPGSTLAEIDASSRAVSALLPECQTTYGLIDASGEPLDPTNAPKTQLEAQAMIELVGGVPVVQTTLGGYLRTFVPLTSDMHPNCTTCHTSYQALPPGTVVGAAAFKVKL